MITVGSLFSGIGGMELGLERTGGFKTIWFCETDPYANAILQKHWSGLKNLGDVEAVDWETVERPEILTGGFPCQDISFAGKGKGLAGARSKLWKNYAKAIRHLRPKLAIVENVPALADRGLVKVLADLADIGYDAEWFTLFASDSGAPHRRERLFVIAHPRGGITETGQLVQERKPDLEGSTHSPNARGNRRKRRNSDEREHQNNSKGKPLPSTETQLGLRTLSPKNADATYSFTFSFKGNANKKIRRFPEFEAFAHARSAEDLKGRPDLPEPLLRRNIYGLSNGLHRIRCLGNAIVPQVAQIIGEAILEAQGELNGRTNE